MTGPGRTLTLAWGARPLAELTGPAAIGRVGTRPDAIPAAGLGPALAGLDAQYHAQVHDVDELRALLARVHLDCLDSGVAQQIDVWAGSWHPDEDDLPDPLIQALVGNPDRGSVLWHEPDRSWIASHSSLPILPGAIRYDRGGQGDDLDPAHARLTPADVPDVLSHFLTTGERSPHLAWLPMPD